MGREQFIGAWKLTSLEFRRADGTVSYPLGKDPVGCIIYDAAGHMSAQLRRAKRPKFVSRDRLKGTAEEIKAAFEGYIAYYGAFEVKEEERIVIHHTEGSTFPNEEGKDFVRHYEFFDDKLILSTPPMPMGGEMVTGVLIWERSKEV